MAYTQREYKESDSVKKFRENMEAQGAYQNKWQPQIDDTMNSILNRKAFQYDVNGDALYQQYKDRYVNLGQQAMMDTMGQAAKLTGGYGNSNAQMVGQQAYQGYLQGLTDKIPELAQAAYQRYAQQGQDLYQRYGLLNTQEQADYNRWATERDWLNNRFNAERVFDYGAFRDTVGDDQWKAQFDEDLRRYELARAEAAGGGGGGGGGGSGGGGSRSPGKSAGYNDALYLVENSSTKSSQESVIQNAYDKGYITQSEAKSLSNKVGNTKYTKK